MLDLAQLLCVPQVHPQFDISPDDSNIAFSWNKTGEWQIYEIEFPSPGVRGARGGGEITQLTSGTGGRFNPRYSPDGTRLAYILDIDGSESYHLIVYDRVAKTHIDLTPSTSQALQPNFCWSPDGRQLALLSNEQGHFRASIISATGRDAKLILDTGHPAWQVEWSPDAKHLAVCCEMRGQDYSIFIVDLETNEVIELTINAQDPAWSPNGMQLWMIDLAQGQPIQLTKSMPENLSNEEFVMPEEIYYEGMDGVQIPALLFRQNQIPAPAVVMIHGGPNWHYSAEWNPVMAHLTSRGYVVFAPNYRGSTGYGRDWQYAAQYDLGGVDTRDIAAGARFLICQGLADKELIAVTGRSHGGYLTMTCLTQFPELWCAGSAVMPFMNWFKSHLESREDLQHWNIENMGDPKENYARWYNASPYFFLDRVKAPVQLICGANDPRCPASDSVDARDKLAELGKEVELIVYEDEGHSFLRIENVINSELRRVEFLGRALEK